MLLQNAAFKPPKLDISLAFHSNCDSYHFHSTTWSGRFDLIGVLRVLCSLLLMRQRFSRHPAGVPSTTRSQGPGTPLCFRRRMCHTDFTVVPSRRSVDARRKANLTSHHRRTCSTQALPRAWSRRGVTIEIEEIFATGLSYAKKPIL
jgi:hypothetical protein